MQYLSIFHVLLCVFGGAIYLIFYGIESVLLASKIFIPSSHNIVTSLCCHSVERFIRVVAIMRYDYKITLNIIVNKLSVVGTC